MKFLIYLFRYSSSKTNDSYAKEKNVFKSHNFEKSSTKLPQPKEEKNTLLGNLKILGSSIRPPFQLPNLFQDHKKKLKTEHVYSSDNDIWKHTLRRYILQSKI